MTDGLYHRTFGFPPGACAPWVGQFAFRHTAHSLGQCVRRATGSAALENIVINDGEFLEIEAQDIFEIEVKDGKPVKALVRLVYSDTQDIVLALCAPEGFAVRCKTLWLNSPDDQHKTLKTAYIKP